MKKIFGFILVLFFALGSCSHEEGYGGLATIEGKVYGKNFNSSGILVSQGYRGDVKVYISKHGDPAYFDSMDSAYDGSFRFKNLYKGTYDIWVYGDCDYCTWDQVYTLTTVEVSKKETATIEDLVVSF